MQSSLVSGLRGFLAVGSRIRSGLRRRNFEFGYRFFDRMTGVVVRVGFITRTMLCNLANHFFWIFAAGECAFGKSPVVFGLAQICPWRGLAFSAVVVARRVLGIDV